MKLDNKTPGVTTYIKQSCSIGFAIVSLASGFIREIQTLLRNPLRFIHATVSQKLKKKKKLYSQLLYYIPKE